MAIVGPRVQNLSDDEKPFGKILAESNNLIYKDYSLGGCSNPKMLLQLNDAIEKNDHEDSIAIFFLTSYTRIINWRDIAKSTINAAGLDDIDKNYAKYFYTDEAGHFNTCLLYTSPSPRDNSGSRMPSSA